MRCAANLLTLVGCFIGAATTNAARPNIVLVMADDQGWGQTGYYGHPVLKTPHLDAMAEAGLRFDRFYAAAPVCSPTRASVLTGRTNLRVGVMSHGYALRRQEKTLAAALQAAGYATGHFGKWHLNGLRGPGVPILKEDTHNPGAFGFDEWLSVTNFFDRDPILSHQGRFREFEGDSSVIVVDQALDFIRKCTASGTPSFSVIWYGTPHSPFMASAEDKAPFDALDKNSREHYGELVAMDRSIGTLRRGLRELGIAENTVVWFTSDNGGLPKIKPDTVGGLRGNKGSLYEGGLRVPCILEWPGKVKPRVTRHPAVSMDIFPTLAEIVELPDSTMLQPQDGVSLVKLFSADPAHREKPIPFSCFGNSALIDNDYKIIFLETKQKHELYNLQEDPKETTNLMKTQANIAQQMQVALAIHNQSINASQLGKDYPEGKVNAGEPEPRFWMSVKQYQSYFDEWRKRPEYKSRIENWEAQQAK